MAKSRKRPIYSVRVGDSHVEKFTNTSPLKAPNPYIVRGYLLRGEQFSGIRRKEIAIERRAKWRQDCEACKAKARRYSGLLERVEDWLPQFVALSLASKH